MIDDFCVADPQEWQTVGSVLLAEATQQAKARGAAIAIVVTPHLDQEKRAMLQAEGHSLASEWYVKPL
jgi:2-keto-3-deoxy-6-phosphogluconate aldolase